MDHDDTVMDPVEPTSEELEAEETEGDDTVDTGEEDADMM